MYYNLTSALVDRFIEEIRGLWASHPKYPDLAENIQGKFSYTSRPQRGMVVKTTGGSNIRLQADNYQGLVMSHALLTRVGDKPGISIEWVRENNLAIKRNGGVFPSPPGVYYINMTKSNLDPNGAPYGDHEFMVYPNLEVVDEAVNMVSPTQGFVGRPYINGTVRIWEIPSNNLLEPGVDYTGDPETGEITLNYSLPTGMYLSADYYYLGEESGPFVIYQDRANYEAIPGVVLAFGRRITPEDQMAVMVSRRREPSALEYGGRWDISIDIEMWARDVDDQREITDLMMAWVPSVLREKLTKYGIEIKDVSFGGETEEPYDNTADDYFFGSSLSVSLETDWSLHVPLPSKIWRIVGVGTVVTEINNLELYSDSRMRAITDLGLVTFEDPFFTSLGIKMESIR